MCLPGDAGRNILLQFELFLNGKIKNLEFYHSCTSYYVYCGAAICKNDIVKHNNTLALLFVKCSYNNFAALFASDRVHFNTWHDIV